MEEMKVKLGPAYVQPQRPIGMGMAIVKVACICAWLLVKEAMGPAVGPTQFVVETKRGGALLQWTIQMAMEAKPKLAAASLENSNTFGEIERDCIQTAI